MPRVTTIIAVAAGLGFLGGVLATNRWGFSWATPWSRFHGAGSSSTKLEPDHERLLAESLAQVATLTATALRLQSALDAHAHSGGAVIDCAGQIAALPKCPPCTETGTPRRPAGRPLCFCSFAMLLVMRRRAWSHRTVPVRLGCRQNRYDCHDHQR